MTELTPELAQWLARNKLNGIDDEVLLARLEQQGLSAQEARTALHDLVHHPIFNAAAPLARQLRRRHAMMEATRYLKAQLPRQTIDIRDTVAPDTFFSEYYYANRPLHLRHQVDHWRMLRRWTPAWFAEQHGRKRVIAQLYRERDHNYHLNTEDHFYELYLADLVEQILAEPHSNDSYLVLSFADLLEQGLDLYGELEPLPGLLDMSGTRDINLWFGPGGTVTRLHYDVKNYLLVQIHGRKRVWLVPPDQAHLVYEGETIYGAVDAEHPDLTRHPLFERADVFVVDLAPGDALFIPVGWWHQVRSLEVSISLNFGNFVVSNKFHW